MLNFLGISKNSFLGQLVTRLAVLLAIIIASIIILFFISKEIRSKASSIADLRQQIEELNLAGESFAGLLKEYQLISPYADDLKEVLPTKDKLIDFSKESFDLATSLGLDLNFLFKGEEIVNDLPTVGFSMSFSKASLPSLMKFLEAFKNSHYFIDISSLDIARKPVGQELSVAINGRIFIKNESR